ncbi:MAG: NTP transferase domain-containing protein, partial [Gammaproteobacteria bacterium]|nr:NTP transferase domain-containing protein [Gammaproteobacteria bacterium]
MALDVIVLAAGQGTRMRSRRPKVLHEIGGRPMLSHVLDTARALSPERLHVVIGAGADEIRRCHAEVADVSWVEQPEQLGSGHAVLQAMPGVSDEATVLVLYADVPLVGTATLEACVSASGESRGVALVTAEAACPEGLGRIVRDVEGGVAAVVEHRDATDAQRGITEI